MHGSRQRALVGVAAVAFAFVAPVSGDRPTGVVPSLRTVENRSDWSGTVSAFPAPGTLTANPDTGISLRGVTANDLGELRVVGTESGRHPGAAEPHPDGEGVTFVPRRPFRPGEVVAVRTGLDVRGGRGGTFRFGIARPDGGGGANRTASQASEEEEESDVAEPDTLAKYDTYRTTPGVHPPKIEVLDPADDPGRGYVFLGPKDEALQRGTMIIDPAGDLVWFRPGGTAYDLKVQEYRGEKVLTWWEGTENRGYGSGEYVIADETYREIARVRAGNGYDADLHDMVITSRGTALLMIYSAVQWNLTPVGGPERRPVHEAVVQEVDIETGAVLFEWHSLGAVLLAESYQDLDADGRIYDYIHPNSVRVDDDGDLLVSARHTSAVYKIDRETGRIIWRLGGKRSDFELGPGVRFGWQHDAQRQDDGSLTIFDNGGNSEERRLREASRGITLDLDMDAMTAELVREYRNPDREMAFSQANMQLLPNGNVFIGWGSLPRFTEYSPDGEVRFDARLSPEAQSYRAFRHSWTGRPATRPAVVAEAASGGAAVVYASWNGATEVADWQVLAGRNEDRLEPVTTVPRDGFETTIVADDVDADWVVAVRAKDDDGSTLATSPAVPVQR